MCEVIGIIFWLSVLLAFYVYLGYPILVTLLAALVKARIHGSEIFPTVTILIAAYNEEKVIASKLENCLQLAYPLDRLQILVAADGSEDRTVEIVKSYASKGVDLSFSPERRGKMSALNNAMHRASHEIVLFSDANNFYDANTLRELVKSFADTTVGAVSGGKAIQSDGNALGSADGLYWKYESFIKVQETKLDSCVGVSGEIFAIRRDLFTPPPASIINDDFYIALQIIKKGYRVVYEPAARSVERASLSEQDEITRRARMVAGRYQAIAEAFSLLPYRRPLLVWQIVSHKFLRPFVPFAMLSALIASTAALFFSQSTEHSSLLFLSYPYNWFVWAFQALFYLAAWLGSRIRIGGLLGKIFYLPVFLVNSNYAALLGLYRYLNGSQTAVWKKVSR